ncbi:MAG TPA: prepilin-type N-terminal cleavage/methylation domain-containing protein [Deltaproteobacteria bacterium]|nr:prepilin-type N-terminal cleavage/methylation domain-containing protein [Deltaproteobacteria bacterium]HPR54613.1 prepilin-type N-terminal cleavage/methylation domain-containing protein [Deltaproteobacteria bacterium]HXK47255.1 prepilin-type N-terminal cleavage/methylation domain-containing protein [Deltaproteobacteria bacterium]
MARGFTLIEVLIAIVILSITFIWLLSAESQGIDMAMRARFLTTSTLLAQDRISEVTSGERTVSTGESKGDFGEDYPGYTYVEGIEATPLSGYLKYSLTVKWGGEGSTLETKIISFISEK